MKTELEKLMPEQTLTNVFGYANFGSISNRDVVKYGLLKTACGYRNGSTAECILNELGLTTKKQVLTKSGKQYLYEAFNNGSNL